MFIRFVYETPYDKGLSCGPFTGLEELREEGKLETYEEEWANEIFEWFNEFLPCPPWKKEGFHWSAVSWFKEDTAIEFIGKMWETVGILKRHNVPIKVMRTESPGLILYSDEFQVVAVSPHSTDCDFRKNSI